MPPLGSTIWPPVLDRVYLQAGVFRHGGAGSRPILTAFTPQLRTRRLCSCQRAAATVLGVPVLECVGRPRLRQIIEW